MLEEQKELQQTGMQNARLATKTQLTVIEVASGSISIECKQSVLETGQEVFLRPSHLFGQLIAAAQILLNKRYNNFNSAEVPKQPSAT